jgi:hypothetical protein
LKSVVALGNEALQRAAQVLDIEARLSNCSKRKQTKMAAEAVPKQRVNRRIALLGFRGVGMY